MCAAHQKSLTKVIMSVTQATVTSMQVAVRCRRNVGSLLIDMSIDTWLIYQSRCVGRVSDEISADILVDMSTDTS